MQLAVLVLGATAIAFSAPAETRTAAEPPRVWRSASAIDPVVPDAEPGGVTQPTRTAISIPILWKAEPGGLRRERIRQKVKK